MCSFLATTKTVTDLVQVNYFQQKRGPDLTTTVTHGPFTIVHNLLSITGELAPQPFINNDIAAFFNGEIYNYQSFGHWKSDGEVLIPLYEEYGSAFVEKLDGEFAIGLIDLKKKTILLSTDVFGTKPLWFSFENGNVGIASYKSSLDRLGFTDSEQLPPNCTRTYSLVNHSLLSESPVHTFDLRQYKTSYDDCIRAFSESIRKRSAGVTKRIFLGLSSGYDSGAIACELQKQNIDFKPFIILGGENDDIITARKHYHSNCESFRLSIPEFIQSKNYLRLYAEDSFMNILPEARRGSWVSENTGAIGLSAICARARKTGNLVLFSGQGADEIISDYGFKGKKYAKHSSFGGNFPYTLEHIFPWRNFYAGTQRAYLDKEEFVAGSYGIETRYPFLDTNFVQEFLSLTSDLKNKEYKAPLHAYFQMNRYPFDQNEKRGFSPVEFTRIQKFHPLLLIDMLRNRLRTRRRTKTHLD
jgi:asparagine synthetase B (glutamine-hydrolysing)